MEFLIEYMERDSVSGGVSSISWRAIKLNGVYCSNTYGLAKFNPDPSSENFIPFEQLTKEIVTEWVKSSLGEQKLQEIENYLTAELEKIMNPPKKSGLPW